MQHSGANGCDAIACDRAATRLTLPRGFEGEKGRKKKPDLNTGPVDKQLHE